MASLCFDLVPSRAEPSYTWTSATAWTGYLRDDQGGWWGGGKVSCAAFDNSGATFSLDTNPACNRYAWIDATARRRGGGFEAASVRL